MAKAKKAVASVELADLDRRIHVVRGQRVMLDADLAALYGVRTAVINQAVKRNPERFPDDFAYPLSQQELRNLMSQTVTSSSTHGGVRKLPWVFTEHGVAMLSSVLRSPQAVQVNIEIVRAFVRMRRLLATPGELVEQLNRLAETVDSHSAQIKAVTDVLRQMMQPPLTPPKPRIGFQTTTSAGSAR